MSSRPPFDDPRIPIDERLGERIQEQLDERAFEDFTNALETQREEITKLEEQLGQVHAERDKLNTRVQSLLDQINDLEDQLQDEPVDVRFETSDVFQRFGGALEDAQKQLREENRDYEIGNVKVHLRANIVGEGSGLKLQFPGEQQQLDAGSIGEFDFDLRPSADRETGTYEEIPSVKGRNIETAMRMISDHGFEGEIVEHQEAEEPDIVLDQFPRARSIAEPGTTIDLIVSEPLPDEDTEDTEDDTDDLITDRDESEHNEDDRESEETESNENGGESDIENQDERDARLQLEAISGIGTVYARRLRETGIDDLTDLAESDPRRIARDANLSSTRVKTWVEQAQSLVETENG